LQRCILCGRNFEIEESKSDPYEDEEDQLKKPPAFCQICQAKLKREADETQKIPKPM